MNRLFEIIYWVKIFLSPNLVIVLLLAILSSTYDFKSWYLLLFIPSIIYGTLLAERVRKKYGTSNFFSKTMNTPDIKETWEIENQKELKNKDH